MEIEKQDLIIEILNLEMEEIIEVIRILKEETSNNLEKMIDKKNIMFLKII